MYHGRTINITMHMRTELLNLLSWAAAHLHVDEHMYMYYERDALLRFLYQYGVFTQIPEGPT